ncbi:MAG: hypothetical protein FWG02_05225 [Holophagaceae bacterium]|nr:hypothetical protein [Holophagaceae bacterium]
MAMDYHKRNCYREIGFVISKGAEGLSAEKLLALHYDYFAQWIAPTKMKVILSSELSAKICVSPELKSSVEKMKEWVENGVDVNCFHSEKRKKMLNVDSDFAVNQHQFHLYHVLHLHLSAHKNDVLPKVGKNGFAPRNKNLLLVTVYNNTVYFIDVISHPTNNSRNEWFRRNCLVIIENNWPEILEDSRLPMGTQMIPNVPDDALQCLTEYEICTGIDTGKNVYLPLYKQKKHYFISKTVTNAIFAENWVRDNFDQILSEFSKICQDSNIPYTGKPDFHYYYCGNERAFLIVEKKTTVAFHPKKLMWLVPATEKV